MYMMHSLLVLLACATAQTSHVSLLQIHNSGWLQSAEQLSNQFSEELRFPVGKEEKDMQLSPVIGSAASEQPRENGTSLFIQSGRARAAGWLLEQRHRGGVGPECDEATSPYVVVVVFAGRRDRMPLLLHNVDTLLNRGEIHEVHLWNRAINAEDKAYVDGASNDGTITSHTPLQTQYGAVWEYYDPVFGDFSPACDGFDETNTVLIKVDDDIVFIDAANFHGYVDYISKHPDTFAVHANVINNGVALYYQSLHSTQIRDAMLSIGVNGDFYPQGGYGGEMWQSSAAATLLHELFLNESDLFHWSKPQDECILFQAPKLDPEHKFTSGQGRFSINFIGLLWSKLNLRRWGLDTCIGDDEWCLTVKASELGLVECMYTNLNVAHLSFGPQEMGMDIPNIVSKYQAKFAAESSSEDDAVVEESFEDVSSEDDAVVEESVEDVRSGEDAVVEESVDDVSSEDDIVDSEVDLKQDVSCPVECKDAQGATDGICPETHCVSSSRWCGQGDEYCGNNGQSCSACKVVPNAESESEAAGVE